MKCRSHRALCAVALLALISSLAAFSYVLGSLLIGWSPTADESRDASKQTLTDIFAENKAKLEARKGTISDPNKGSRSESGNSEPLLDHAPSLVGNPDINARVRIVRQLKNQPSEKSVEILSRFLDDKNKNVVLSALHSLGQIGRDPDLRESVFRLLEEKATDQGFSEHGTALVIAATLGEDERLFPIISDYIYSAGEYESEVNYAAKALAAIPSPQHLELLARILNLATEPEVRLSAIHTLSRIDSNEALQILEHHLTTENEEDRLSVVWALSLKNNPEYQRVLLDGVEDGKFSEDALSILARNPAGPDVLEVSLRSDILEKDKKLRMLQLFAENMTLASNDVREGLSETVHPLLDDPNVEFQIQALKILGMGFGGGETTEIMGKKLYSPNKMVRREALKAYLPYLRKENYKQILELIWDGDVKVRRQALGMAERFLDESDIGVLRRASSHEDEMIRDRVLQLLGTRAARQEPVTEGVDLLR